MKKKKTLPPRHLILEKRGRSLWIFLNRPEVKNAFSLEMADELLVAVKQGMSQSDISAIVLSGKGGVFSAGGDIKMMSETKAKTGSLRKFFLQISQKINRVVIEMRKGKKPVLACLSGYVGGVALGLVTGADLRVASTEAKFCAATIQLGLVANGSATYHLPRLIGWGRATEMFLLGDTVSAPDALTLGLVNRVFQPEDLEKETHRLLEKLDSRSPKALGRLKELLLSSASSSCSNQMEKERQAIAWSSTTPEFEKGMNAFLGRRKK